MKVQQTHKRLIIELLIYLVVVVLGAAACFFMSGQLEQSKKKVERVESQVDKLKQKIRLSDVTNVEFAEAVRKWQSLSPEAKKLTGLRINDAKDMVDYFKEAYELYGVSTSFSKPQELSDKAFKKDTLSTVYSEVSVNFSSVSDAHAFNFVHALEQYFPGYIQVTSFSLSRNQDLTQDIFYNIVAGEQIPTVTATLVFKWWDFKERKAVNEKEGEK